jgi:hypothetical protein
MRKLLIIAALVFVLCLSGCLGLGWGGGYAYYDGWGDGMYQGYDNLYLGVGVGQQYYPNNFYLWRGGMGGGGRSHFTR